MTAKTTIVGPDQKEIKKTFKDYFSAVEKKNNKKTLDYIYPKLFDHFPKDKMLQAMNRMKADPAIVVSTDNGSIANISEVLEVAGIKYALIRYSFDMTMTITEKDDEPDLLEDESEDKPSSRADDTYEFLKEKYGEKNIAFDRVNSRLKIAITNEMYTIDNPAFTGWKFLEKKNSMKAVLRKLLPRKVLKEL